MKKFDVFLEINGEKDLVYHEFDELNIIKKEIKQKFIKENFEKEIRINVLKQISLAISFLKQTQEISKVMSFAIDKNMVHIFITVIDQPERNCYRKNNRGESIVEKRKFAKKKIKQMKTKEKLLRKNIYQKIQQITENKVLLSKIKKGIFEQLEEDNCIKNNYVIFINDKHFEIKLKIINMFFEYNFRVQLNKISCQNISFLTNSLELYNIEQLQYIDKSITELLQYLNMKGE